VVCCSVVWSGVVAGVFATVVGLALVVSWAAVVATEEVSEERILGMEMMGVLKV
jgi:hypothetical protein